MLSSEQNIAGSVASVGQASAEIEIGMTRNSVPSGCCHWYFWSLLEILNLVLEQIFVNLKETLEKMGSS